MPKIEWFATCFPGRRADRPVVEVAIDFENDKKDSFPRHSSQIRDLLIESGLLSGQDKFPYEELPDGRENWYTSLLLQTALLLQKKAGHRVSFFSILPGPREHLCVGLLEHEHCDVGMTAVKLAGELVSGKRKALAEPFRVFEKFARDRLLPLDTEAIIRAAKKHDIPTTKLERQPYRRSHFDELTGGQCIRQNSLLMLGHGLQQKILDGTFLLDNAGQRRDLLNNPNRRAALLESLDIPIIPGDGKYPAGKGRFQLLSINGKIVAAIDQSGGNIQPLDTVNQSTIDQALSISQAVGCAPLAITVGTDDISSPLAAPASGVLDFDLAPELDRLPGSRPSLMATAADEIIEWLFADKSAVRMPVFAITGTNGKTTTTRMISHILARAGQRPGLVCTTGIFLNGRQIESEDQCTDTGHLKALLSKEVDVAVLETHHLGIIQRGFAFDWCDIAVCLNVTEDHLGTAHVDTVEQMAEVKRAVPETARRGAVLNADDAHCLAMLGSMTAEKTCLVSMKHTLESLQGLSGYEPAGNRSLCFCILEQISGQEWLVIHDQNERFPVVAVRDVPVTLDGSISFNVSNTMHAVAATFLAGLEIELISSAMRDFRPEYEANPGRMNVFDDLPFRVVLDFAHNPDGLSKLSEFVDQQKISGRKLIAFAGGRHKSGPVLKKMAAPLAGHYDFYYCRDYDPKPGEKLEDIAHFLQEGLLEAGVEKGQTAIISYGKKAIFELFDGCRPGDLLVIIVGYREQHDFPGYINEYASTRERPITS